MPRLREPRTRGVDPPNGAVASPLLHTPYSTAACLRAQP